MKVEDVHAGVMAIGAVWIALVVYLALESAWLWPVAGIMTAGLWCLRQVLPGKPE